MNKRRKSDGSIVSEKPPNKGEGAPSPAEAVERRSPTKGNSIEHTRSRTQSRTALANALDRVRQVAKRDKETKFTALWHHVYNVDRLRKAYFSLKRKAAPGMDEETWPSYGENLEGNLQDLSERLKRGAYRARPVRRVYIPKGDGGQRPIGVPVLEDKIVQRATADVLNAIYEVDFLNFSHGFRPGRSQHNALDAVTVGLTLRKVNWVLDADIRGFFDAIDHEWLVKFIEHRISDKRVVRHIKKWLNAGVLDDGQWRRIDEGTPQGGSISPLLANVYLHYVFDLWAEQWRRLHARGDVIIVRFADDFVMGFERKHDAEKFQEELVERLRKFGLELHPDKTRLIEFGRYAAERRAKRGVGKPETFDFLGFTHVCDTRKGKFVVLRKTMRSRMQRKLTELKQELRKRLHWPIPKVGEWLQSVLRGHYRYYGVPNNRHALSAFRYYLTRLWLWTLRRRSQRHRMSWSRMGRIEQRWLPRPKIHRPYPSLQPARRT